MAGELKTLNSRWYIRIQMIKVRISEFAEDFRKHFREEFLHCKI